jgi:hypothetical protein
MQRPPEGGRSRARFRAGAAYSPLLAFDVFRVVFFAVVFFAAGFLAAVFFVVVFFLGGICLPP